MFVHRYFSLYSHSCQTASLQQMNPWQEKLNLGGLLFCFFPGLLMLFAGCEKPRSVLPPPNVVIIVADDQGWGDLSLHGNPNLQTPNLDRLAREGAQFAHFFVNPVCSPTRAALLTGRYAARGGVYDTSEGGERMNANEVTFGTYFQQAGYQTACYGKWHNGGQFPYHPNAKGFADFYGFCSGHWGDYFSPMLEHNGEIVQGEGYLSDDLTLRAIQFMEQNRNQPFLVYLPFNTPHSPMQVPDTLWERFVAKPLLAMATDPAKEDSLFTRAALAMCENIDQNVGKIIDFLEQSGLENNTLVVYLSDNGPNSWRWNGGLKGKKGDTDEGGIKSPLFVRWKGKVPAGTMVPVITGDIDLLPTLAGLAQIPFQPVNPLDGLDLSPWVLGLQPEWPNRILPAHWAGKTSVRDQNFRLDHTNRLYHPGNDPGQTLDLSTSRSDDHQRLLAAKTAWEQEVLAGIQQNKPQRPFTLGHPEARYDHLPASDGQAFGQITRSNQWPNCSFFTHWKRTEDYLAWPIEVLEEGWFEVMLYYTCPEQAVGATVVLDFMGEQLSYKLQQAYDPPLRGMEYDRYPRQESYVKDFLGVHMGNIYLTKGTGTLTFRATDIPAGEVMDFRMFTFKRMATL
jgi:arylsulfatase A-like enzyme